MKDNWIPGQAGMTESRMVLVFYCHTAYKAEIHWFQQVMDAGFKTLYESIFQARADPDLNSDWRRCRHQGEIHNEVDDGSRKRH